MGAAPRVEEAEGNGVEVAEIVGDMAYGDGDTRRGKADDDVMRSSGPGAPPILQMLEASSLRWTFSSGPHGI